MSGHLYIFSAPSGGGKTSLAHALVSRFAALGVPAQMSVSYTTRAPRQGEQDGVHYCFVDDAQFEKMVAQDAFLEHAQVFGRRYGTSRERTRLLLERGVDVILDIDWQGARQVRRVLPTVQSIFILPPSLAELDRRLRGRCQDDEVTIAKRMAEARQEIEHYDEYDYVIVNDQFDQALAQLLAIFSAQRTRRAAQQAALTPLVASLLTGE